MAPKASGTKSRTLVHRSGVESARERESGFSVDDEEHHGGGRGPDRRLRRRARSDADQDEQEEDDRNGSGGLDRVRTCRRSAQGNLYEIVLAGAASTDAGRVQGEPRRNSVAFATNGRRNGAGSDPVREQCRRPVAVSARSASRRLRPLRATMAAAMIAPINWVSGCPPERTRNVAPATAATLAALPLRAARRTDRRRRGMAAATMLSGYSSQAMKAPERENPTAPSEAESRERPRSRSQRKRRPPRGEFAGEERDLSSAPHPEQYDRPDQRGTECALRITEQRLAAVLARIPGRQPARPQLLAGESKPGHHMPDRFRQYGRVQSDGREQGLQGEHRDSTSLQSNSPGASRARARRRQANPRRQDRIEARGRSKLARAIRPGRVVCTPIAASIEAVPVCRYAVDCVEPTTGLEPVTCGLRNRTEGAFHGFSWSDPTIPRARRPAPALTIPLSRGSSERKNALADGDPSPDGLRRTLVRRTKRGQPLESARSPTVRTVRAAPILRGRSEVDAIAAGTVRIWRPSRRTPGWSGQPPSRARHCYRRYW